MKLAGRIQVEQLEDERLVNIERHVVANAKIGPLPEHASRRLLAFAGAMVAVAAAAVIGWKLRGHGAAMLAPPAMPERMAIATEAQRSVLTLADAGATIASDPGSSFDVVREHGKVIVKMTRGKLDLAVEHREDRLLVVRAGETDVEDVGTKFSVAWDGGAGDVDVKVREGAVKVKRVHEDVLVAKGQEWRTGAGVFALVEEPAGVGSGAAGATIAAASTQAPNLVIATKEPTVLRDRHGAVPAPVASAPKRVEPDAAPVLGEAIPPGHRAAAAAAAKVPNDPYVDLKVAIHKQPLAFDPKIDGQGDAAAEIARLKKIAYSPVVSDEASQALYRIAVLLHKPLRQDSEALRTLDVYRRRFVAGKELDAVLWLRVRISCGATIDDECRKAAYSYQQRSPSGAAGEVALRITNAQ